MVLRSGSAALLAIVALVFLGPTIATGEAGAQAAPLRVEQAPTLPLALPVMGPVVGCSTLTTANVSEAVGAKTRVETRAIADGDNPSCTVKVVVDDYAQFEMHLPSSAWNQRLLFGGGPGSQVNAAVKLDQFATVSWQDLGRRGNEDVFAHDFQARINNGYRGMHLQVLAAKALIARFYGRGPRFSYYNACSNPGREGMIEVQRFPQDFDGVGAGCPPIATTLNNGLFYAWNVMTNTGPDGNAIITEDKLPIFHKAVLVQCDAADGATDGIVSDPFDCHPSFASVTCPPGQNRPNCVTAAQVHVAEELYRGIHDEEGAMLAPGGVLPGSELAWTATIVPTEHGGQEEARAQTTTALRSQFSYPALPTSWRLSDIKFDRATFFATTKLQGLYGGTNPDLSGFHKGGHKLIMWMALGDTNVLPAQAILYYAALRQQMGATATDDFVRLFLLPGVHHCGGGDGPALIDLLVPLMNWVEQGIPPNMIAGAHRPRRPGEAPQGAGRPATALAPDLTRPLFPYPYTARFIGSGNVRDAANWVRGPERYAPVTRLADWPGANFFKPGVTKWCTATSADLACSNGM